MLGLRIATITLCSFAYGGFAVAQTPSASVSPEKPIVTATADTASEAPAPSPAPAAAPAVAAAEPEGAAPPAATSSSAATEAPANDKPVTAVAPAPLPPPTLTVAINLATQTMVVSENGSAKYSWPISSGTAEFPTPRGTFRPQWSAKMWYSRKYDMAPMPHAVFINGGVAVHATQHVSRLGSPASHGCIRLAPGNARTFYNLVHRHGLKMTKVSVFGTPKFRAPEMARNQKKLPQQQFAQNSGSWWFSGPSYQKPVSAYDPRFAKQQRVRAAQLRQNGQGKVVYYRTVSGQVVYVQRPPKVAKYYNNSGW